MTSLHQSNDTTPRSTTGRGTLALGRASPSICIHHSSVEEQQPGNVLFLPMAHVGLLSSRLGAAGWLSGARLSCVSASASASAITFSCGAVTHTRFSQQFSSLVTTWAPATPRSAPTGSTLPLHHELAAAARRHGEQLRYVHEAGADSNPDPPRETQVPLGSQRDRQHLRES